MTVIAITVAITVCWYYWASSEQNASNLLVLLKLIIVFIVIDGGAFCAACRAPSRPIHGRRTKGVSAVFFSLHRFRCHLDHGCVNARTCSDPPNDVAPSSASALMYYYAGATGAVPMGISMTHRPFVSVGRGCRASGLVAVSARPWPRCCWCFSWAAASGSP
jgi:hypothetical protein